MKPTLPPDGQRWIDTTQGQPQSEVVCVPKLKEYSLLLKKWVFAKINKPAQ